MAIAGSCARSGFTLSVRKMSSAPATDLDAMERALSRLLF